MLAAIALKVPKQKSKSNNSLTHVNKCNNFNNPYNEMMQNEIYCQSYTLSVRCGGRSSPFCTNV